ncbi:hypothetical protein PSMK_12760 [Phycisphaera mikurensis NBRC 102666]|uniref:Uncharacterized protein n=1 Tax=Phycisphaera mikurensis (strain NBRC 102666 / KCTC 22515 / FYK2301M01) TaxID=1142394 RepID=I0IDU7_PHYMF|nr:hypothetical protein PSMK_12760 [Phycisphaera mikurensis NBRC 102666]
MPHRFRGGEAGGVADRPRVLRTPHPASGVASGHRPILDEVARVWGLSTVGAAPLPRRRRRRSHRSAACLRTPHPASGVASGHRPILDEVSRVEGLSL